MKKNVLQITLRCVTNLHVGNGDVNYNIIDNEVERDPVTNYPTINASGVKGAFREYFRSINAGENLIEQIFGSDSGSSSRNGGRLKFLTADMLAIPMRASSGQQPYYHVTTKAAVEQLGDNFDFLCGETFRPEEKKSESRQSVEGFDINSYIEFEGLRIFVTDEDNIRNYSLPVLARNCLENGISQNLWYEEVVPHKTLFTTFVIAEESDTDLLKKFRESVEGKCVQFGGNASIGYGICRISVKGGEF